MGTFLAILAAIFLTIFIYGRVSTSNNRKPDDCDMKMKYWTIVDQMLTGHKDARILKETGTEIVVGVDNYGGYTALHIQQEAGNIVRLVYVVKNNPTVKSFLIEKRFRDDMDQTEMMGQLALEIQKKLMR